MTNTHVTIVIPSEYKAWLDKKVEAHDFGSVSHGITQLIRDAIRQEETVKS